MQPLERYLRAFDQWLRVPGLEGNRFKRFLDLEARVSPLPEPYGGVPVVGSTAFDGINKEFYDMHGRLLYTERDLQHRKWQRLRPQYEAALERLLDNDDVIARYSGPHILHPWQEGLLHEAIDNRPVFRAIVQQLEETIAATQRLLNPGDYPYR